MVLLINVCKEKLHYYEFVKPIEDILKKNNLKFFTRHYKKISKEDLKNADKIIICGTSLKDNEFLDDIKNFVWIKDYDKPILGICGGAHVIGLILGKKLKKNKKIGLKKIHIKNFLGINGEKDVYHLHQFSVFSEIYHEGNIYATLFHPEVRNKEIIANFCNNV